MNFTWRIYRRLAEAFPHEFKLAYGVEVISIVPEELIDLVRCEQAGRAR